MSPYPASQDGDGGTYSAEARDRGPGALRLHGPPCTRDHDEVITAESIELSGDRLIVLHFNLVLFIVYLDRSPQLHCDVLHHVV